MTKAYPPQAYTKDILTEAYCWFKMQPDTIKNLVSDADSLVSLYLSQNRPSVFNTKNNPEKFTADLKKLSSELNAFESSPDPNTFEEQWYRDLQKQNNIQTKHAPNSTINPALGVAQELEPPHTPSTAPRTMPKATSTSAPIPQIQPEPELRHGIQEVKDYFFFSTLQDAEHFLMAMGYRQFIQKFKMGEPRE